MGLGVERLVDSRGQGMGAGSSFHTDLLSGKSASEVVLTLAISVGTSRTFQDGLSAPSQSRATQKPHSRIPSVKCVEEECDSCRVTIPPSQLPCLPPTPAAVWPQGVSLL